MNSVSWTAPSSAFTRSAIPAITHPQAAGQSFTCRVGRTLRKGRW
jgi:hypothetical protein